MGDEEEAGHSARYATDMTREMVGALGEADRGSRWRAMRLPLLSMLVENYGLMMDVHTNAGRSGEAIAASLQQVAFCRKHRELCACRDCDRVLGKSLQDLGQLQVVRGCGRGLWTRLWWCAVVVP